MTEFSGRIRDSALTLLSLFTTSGTLVCCALPITLVTLGFGSVVAGLTSTFPWLITLSQHKEWVFSFTAVLLVFGGWMVYRRGRSCPVDPKLRSFCIKFDYWNRRLYWISVSIWSIGFFAAYLLLPINRHLGFI